MLWSRPSWTTFGIGVPAQAGHRLHPQAITPRDRRSERRIGSRSAQLWNSQARRVER